LAFATAAHPDEYRAPRRMGRRSRNVLQVSEDSEYPANDV
jgi:hypothetical protein